MRYRLDVSAHYSGLICGHLPDWPRIRIFGRDHDEVIAMAEEALASEIHRYRCEGRKLPVPTSAGAFEIHVVETS
jgi:hypothetical protein